MPIIQATIVEGRSPEALREFVRQLTDSAVNALGAPAESVKVTVVEVPPTHYGSGNQTVAEKNAAKNAAN
jgi:4-oxalocrotonate tautomerase